MSGLPPIPSPRGALTSTEAGFPGARGELNGSARGVTSDSTKGDAAVRFPDPAVGGMEPELKSPTKLKIRRRKSSDMSAAMMAGGLGQLSRSVSARRSRKSTENYSPSPELFEDGLSPEAGAEEVRGMGRIPMPSLPELPESQAGEDAEPGEENQACDGDDGDDEWEEIEIDLAHLKVRQWPADKCIINFSLGVHTLALLNTP